MEKTTLLEELHLIESYLTEISCEALSTCDSSSYTRLSALFAELNYKMDQFKNDLENL